VAWSVTRPVHSGRFERTMKRGNNRHLFLALNTEGLGEGVLGLTLARDLLSQGDEVFFLAHEANEKLFQADLPYLTFTTDAAALLMFYLNMCLASFRPSSLILSDYLSTVLLCEGVGQDPTALTSLGIPVAAIDTWDSTRSPDHIDLFADGFDQAVPRLPKALSICPVPFVAPHKDSKFYRSLPLRTTPQKGYDSARNKLGIPEGAKVVMFCSAQWQHPGPAPKRVRKNTTPRHREYVRQWGMSRRLSANLPKLLAEYVARLGQQVHLVHVGPRAFAVQEILQGRYHWRPALPPQEFDQLLSEVDLLVTANISATTISKAMVNQVPVMVLQNRVLAFTREEAEAQMKEPASSALGAWLERSVPLFPFALWPLGYHRFVAPLLEDNPYMKAVEVVEMLDERRVEGILHGLLFDRTARAEQAHRQAAYLSHVRSLPSGAQLVNAHLG
jgi:Family of unknown function (DUF6365)